MTRIYRKSSTGAAFQMNLNQANVGWKKRSVSTKWIASADWWIRATRFIHPTFLVPACPA